MKFVLSLRVGHSSVKTQASVAVVFPCILDIPAWWSTIHRYTASKTNGHKESLWVISLPPDTDNTSCLRHHWMYVY